MFKEQQTGKCFWHVIGLIGLAIWENATAVAWHVRRYFSGGEKSPHGAVRP